MVAYVLYNSTYNIWKRKNYSSSKKVSSCRKYSVYYDEFVTIDLSKLMENTNGYNLWTLGDYDVNTGSSTQTKCSL